MTVAAARRKFYRLARQAINQGRLTEIEMNAICRPGTRKARYWVRHLRDLRAVLAERGATQQGGMGRGHQISSGVSETGRGSRITFCTGL